MSARLLKRLELVSWLEREGFCKVVGSSGHWRFERGTARVVIVGLGHGGKDMNRKELGLLIRQLEQAGYERRALRARLGLNGGS